MQLNALIKIEQQATNATQKIEKSQNEKKRNLDFDVI